METWYFALSQELIFRLKVHQKAGICMYNLENIAAVTPLDWTSTAGGGDCLCTHPQYDRFNHVQGQGPWCVDTNCDAMGHAVFCTA